MNISQPSPPNGYEHDSAGKALAQKLLPPFHSAGSFTEAEALLRARLNVLNGWNAIELTPSPRDT